MSSKLKVTHDALTKKGSYQDAEGNQKNSYQNIGVLFSNEEGKPVSLKLNALPLPNKDGEVWINFFSKKEEK